MSEPLCEQPEHLERPCPYCGAEVGESCFKRGSALRLPLWHDTGFRVSRLVHKARAGEKSQ